MIRTLRFAGFVMLALIATFQAASTTPRAVAKAAIELTPCKPEGITGEAKCGTLEVFENRATQKGRKIKINVLVLPATGPQRDPDALFYFAGGPGSAATEDARGIAQILANVRQRRDLVFVDQRGTGQSNPLNCELFNSADPQSYFGFFLPLDDGAQVPRATRTQSGSHALHDQHRDGRHRRRSRRTRLQPD